MLVSQNTNPFETNEPVTHASVATEILTATPGSPGGPGSPGKPTGP